MADEAKPRTNAEKYPDLWKQFVALGEEEEAIRARSQKLRDERDALRARRAEIEVQEEELRARISAIELPRLGEIANQRAVLARAMGGRSTNDAPAPAPEAGS